MELKCILVLAKSEPEGCIYIGRIQHLRTSHLFYHIGGFVAQIVLSTEQDRDFFHLRCRHTARTNPIPLFHSHGIYQDENT